MNRATKAWLWLLSHVPSIRQTSWGLADGQAGFDPVSDNRHYMNGYRLGQRRAGGSADSPGQAR